MPPLAGVDTLSAPRATGNALMSTSVPGRSRAPSLPIPAKGQARRHRLLRVPACKGTLVALLRLPQAPRMLDEPPAPFLSLDRGEKPQVCICTMRFSFVFLFRGW